MSYPQGIGMLEFLEGEIMNELLKELLDFVSGNMIYIIVAAGLILLLLHLFVIEKYHKQEESSKKVIKRDILGSPIHMIFTIGDSLVFTGIFNYFKDLPQEQYADVFLIGLLVIIVGVMFYRLLQKWFEKFSIPRERNF